jgi:hypothetical protein
MPGVDLEMKMGPSEEFKRKETSLYSSYEMNEPKVYTKRRVS